MAIWRACVPSNCHCRKQGLPRVHIPHSSTQHIQANVLPLANDTIIIPHFAETAQMFLATSGNITHSRCILLVHPFLRAGTGTRDDAMKAPQGFRRSSGPQNFALRHRSVSPGRI